MTFKDCSVRLGNSSSRLRRSFAMNLAPALPADPACAATILDPLILSSARLLEARSECWRLAKEVTSSTLTERLGGIRQRVWVREAAFAN